MIFDALPDGGAAQDATLPIEHAGRDAERDVESLTEVDPPSDPELADQPRQIVQTCQVSSYVDRTAEGADRVLAWSHGFSDDERCLIVRVGQSVRWLGNLSTHPLEAEGGDSPNPIVAHADGVVTFAVPGSFGYVCGLAHAGMYGAIHVVR